MADLKDLPILVIGAGEMATGLIHRLWRSRFRVLATERPNPLAVRRAVSFCEAVHDGRKEVESAVGVRVDDLAGAEAAWQQNQIPILVDPDLTCLADYRPQVVVEATLAKANVVGLKADLAPLVIALGPGFEIPADADFIIETNRGHNLARVIESGRAADNTGVPGTIEGYTAERVLRSPADGIFESDHKISDLVETDEVIATVSGQPVKAQIGGMIRGLIRPGTEVTTGLKVGDVDPRGKNAFPNYISEKARAVGGSVLECIMMNLNT